MEKRTELSFSTGRRNNPKTHFESIKMSEEGKIGPKLILNKNQNVDSIGKKKEKRNLQPRKKGVQRKEPMAGILRVDCSKPRRSSGGSVDFTGLPQRLTTQAEPPSPQPSIDRLSVTFAEKSDCSDSSVKINIFDPGSPPSSHLIEKMEKIRFRKNPTDGEEEEGEDDYSASVSVIMKRRESMKRPSSKRRKRRISSPLPDAEGSFFQESRRRSSEYTNSSGDTAISIENETTQEQIFENIRLHKEVLSNVKFQPWGMRKKIKLVQQAKAYVKRHEGELQERLAMSKSTKDILARFNIWLIKKLRFLKRELANTMTLLIPWELRIKEIESHFGSAVASYFTFLRWMFWVNLVITIVLACFVAIPEMLTADVKTAGERKEMLPEEKLTATNLVTLWDFGGVLKYSPIFYGYYTNRDKSGTGYRLPFAYFMTGLAVYVYSFVATLRRMAENSRMSKLSEKDDECVFTWKIFTGWDYMIGNAETAHNRVASLILGFKEALLEETERKKDEKNWKVICLRVLVSFVVIGLLVFSAYIVFVVVERSTQPDANDSWWRQNEITVSVSIISLLFPFCFELLGLLEGYHPRKSLRIQLARIMVLNLLNLYTLIFSQFWKISDMTIELQNLKSNYTAPFPPTVSTTTMETSAPICVLIAINCTITTTATATATATEAVTSIPPIFINSTDPFELFDSGSNDTLENWIDNENSTGFSLSDRKETVEELLYSNKTGFVADNEDDDAFEKDSTEETASTSLSSGSTGPTDSSSAETASSMETSSSTEMPLSSEFFRSHSTYPTIDFFSSTAEIQTETGSGSDSPRIEFGSREGPLTDSRQVEEDLTSGGKLKSRQMPSSGICFVKKCEEAIENETPDKDVHPSLYDVETRKRLRSLCWETMFGQELVKLTVMDLILTILSVLLLDFFRAIFVRVMNNCWCWDLEKKFPQYGDFKIAENILHLVYNQGMVWMGMFFSPGLPAINLIKLAIMMYLRSWAVLTCNVPHEVVFRASRSNNFYLALLLTMLFLCVLPVGFAIVWIEPSWHCGPFSDYKRIYHLFTKTLQKALPKTLHKAFDYIASPGIIIPLLMLLILIIYYLISLTNSLREANNDLKTQLRRERTEERRKMFQMVNTRARKESKDSEMPLAKWKKLVPELAAKQLALTTDLERGEKNDGEVSADLKKEINRKKLLARLMKKALGKSSGTSEEEDSRSTKEGEALETSRPDSTFVFEEKDSIKKQIRKTRLSIDFHTFSRSGGEKEEDEKPKTTAAGFQNFSRGGNSQPENIPVIKISKIESEDHSPKKIKETGKERFISAVRKSIRNKRKENQDLKKDGEERWEKKMEKDREEEKPEAEGILKGSDETISRRCPIAVEETIPSELCSSSETS